MNNYIDDLKTQNMTLHEELNGMPDKKGGNLQQLIKHLEEALKIKQNSIKSMENLMTEKNRRI